MGTRAPPGRPVGRVTTAASSPRFGPIALGYVHRSHFAEGTAVEGGGVRATVVAAFEVAPGAWCVEIHFEHRPDEAPVRALIGTVAGPTAAQALTFTAGSAKDWVAASLAGLKPVPAGRFLVHGAHDRAGVPSIAFASACTT